MSTETKSKTHRRKSAKVTSHSVKYDRYIYRVLRQVHPDTGLSSESLIQLNNLVRFCLFRIMRDVNTLMSNSNGQKKTVGSREIQTAIRTCFPGELAKHAVSEGTKAVVKYTASIQSKLEDASKKSKSSKSKGRGKPHSRSFKAGLQFPVTRTEKIMMECATSKRKTATSAVYLTAAIEYMTAEVIELAGNAARHYKKHRITPRHILLAIRNDEELSAFYSAKYVILSGGVVPNIDSRLIKTVKAKTEKAEKKSKKTDGKKPKKSKSKKE
jgi:histone H2A